MGYCTFAEVQEKVPHIQLTTETEPTVADVENWIGQVSDGILDPILRVTIALPVSDTVGLEYLRNVAINWVVGEIYRAVEKNSETGALFTKVAMDMIKRLEKTPEMIQEPEVSPRKDRLPSSFTRTLDPTTDDYQFKRQERQW